MNSTGSTQSLTYQPATSASQSTQSHRIELARGRSYIGSLNASRKPEGAGTKFDRSGKIIAQCENFKDGKLLDTGGKYSGGFLNGKFHGLGLFVSEDGHQFEGHWLDGAQNGLGKLTWPNGDVSEGRWKDNVQIDFGMHWNREGKIQHIGRYENGPRQVCPIPRAILPNGTFLNKQEREANILYPNGDYYVGEFSVNFPHGFGRLYNSSHQLLIEGQFLNGFQVTAEFDGSSISSDEKKPMMIREETIVLRPELAATLTTQTSTKSVVDDTVGPIDDSAMPSTYLPQLPIPLHLIKPAGPASLLQPSTTHQTIQRVST